MKLWGHTKSKRSCSISSLGILFLLMILSLNQERTVSIIQIFPLFDTVSAWNCVECPSHQMGAACLYLTIAMVATTVLIHIVYDARSKRGFVRVYTTETTVIFLLINRQLALHSISKKKKKYGGFCYLVIVDWDVVEHHKRCPCMSYTRCGRGWHIFPKEDLCCYGET